MIDKQPFMPTGFSIKLPDRSIHDEKLRLTWRGSLVILAASAPLMIDLAILGASVNGVLPSGVSFVAAPMLGVTGYVAARATRNVIRAERMLDEMYEQWREWQNVNRANATKIADAQVVIVGDRNKVNVHQQNTTNQAVLIDDNRAQTRAEFLRHYSEFVRKAELARKIGDGKTGFERRIYLAGEGAVCDYQFDDGQSITRREYEQLVEMAKQRADAPRDRRKGSAGNPAPPLLEGNYTPIE